MFPSEMPVADSLCAVEARAGSNNFIADAGLNVDSLDCCDADDLDRIFCASRMDPGNLEFSCYDPAENELSADCSS